MTTPSNTATATSYGPSLATLLTVLFVALKLTGQIDWSWWWVLAPLWIGWFIFLLMVVLFGIGFLIYHYRQEKKRAKYNKVRTNYGRHINK